MRIEVKCPCCGKLICKMGKGNEVEMSCKHCKAVFLIGLIEAPSKPLQQPDSS